MLRREHSCSCGGGLNVVVKGRCLYAGGVTCILSLEMRFEALLGCLSAYVVMFAQRLSKYCEVGRASLDAKAST